MIIFISPEIPFCASPKSLSPDVINILTSITIHCCCLVNKSCPALLRFHSLYSLPGSSLLSPLLSPGFPRQEYWNGLLFPPLGDLPNPGIEPLGLWHFCIAGGSFTTESPGKLLQSITIVYSFLGDGNLSSPTRDQTWATCSGSIES